MTKIETLQEFYMLMNQTKEIRREILTLHLQRQTVTEPLIKPLSSALSLLENIPKKDDKYCLLLEENKTITLDLSYEISELKKDINFHKQSEKNFYDYLNSIHKNFLKELEQCYQLLRTIGFETFITDRDGTVNNYCGRYASSIQSIYNGLFLSRFSFNSCKKAIILTSAPLDNIGLIDLSICPKSAFIYAGSKGREYIDKNNERRQFPIKNDKQKVLNFLNDNLSQIVKEPKYKKYSLIGSGLQFKFGQTTIARQDISNSISKEESSDFLKLVSNLVSEIDPQNKFFRIEDTGLDIEIILTIENSNIFKKAKDFDKGDGVNFLDKDLNLKIKSGPCLVCGDTRSDVPMVTAAMKKTPDTWAIFVTTDESLKEEVKKECPRSIFVSTPDILVSALNNLSKYRN